MKRLVFALSGLALGMVYGTTHAACPAISHQQLAQALKESVAAAGGPGNGGLDFHMWATVVGTSGEVCLVARSSDASKGNATLNDQWLLSRVISAQKANTALSLSTQNFALSTANLYSAVQPGGSLFGLQHSNPVDTGVAYQGESEHFGTARDPLRKRRVGGVNVFGGGLALYAGGKLVGGLGVSGDSSCADHNVAWRVREGLGMGAANVPAGVAGADKDNILYLNAGEAPNGFKHPLCGGSEKAVNDALMTGSR